MRITQITASWQETVSLGNYSNVKPSISLTATLDEGDDPAAWKAALMNEARTFVQEQVDAALEANDQPAKYSLEPRYDVRYTYVGNTKIVVIAPADVRIPGRSVYAHHVKHRLATARRLARHIRSEVQE